jgi:hypothetical protein
MSSRRTMNTRGNSAGRAATAGANTGQDTPRTTARSPLRNGAQAHAPSQRAPLQNHVGQPDFNFSGDSTFHAVMERATQLERQY